jgi:hypothetical protein
MVAAAHRGQGTGALHYILNPMRQDALNEAMQMLNQFQTIIGAIKRARRTEALVLTQV